MTLIPIAPKTLNQNLDLCRIQMFMLITGIEPKVDTIYKKYSVDFNSCKRDFNVNELMEYTYILPVEDIEPLQQVIYKQCCDYISLERNLKLLKADGLDISLYEDKDRLWSLSIEDLAYVINNIRDANSRFTYEDLEKIELDGDPCYL